MSNKTTVDRRVPAAGGYPPMLLLSEVGFNVSVLWPC